MAQVPALNRENVYMINKESLSAEWIAQVSAENRKADKILIEKTIRALLLLEGLVLSKLPFIFKGGTALMLLFDSSKRLSIDIDILVSEQGLDVEQFFPVFTEAQGFHRVELQQRNSDGRIRKAHYKFYYKPVTAVAAEDYVLLDVVFDSNHYQHELSLPIRSKFMLNAGEDILVRVPSAEDLLGDKLTAFAPNTTGIPYERSGNSMSMEIIKQLYDIGNLFEVVSTPAVIRETFIRFSRAGISLRNLAGADYTHVSADIFETALCLSLRGAAGTGNFSALQKGIQRVSSFIFSESYYIEKAILHAARAAYLAKLAESNADTLHRYGNATEISGLQIASPHLGKLQKLKKSNPEAFFYWYQAIRLAEKQAISA